ncbi:MAG: alpha/beta hydrolase [Polyangiales bacterium]
MRPLTVTHSRYGSFVSFCLSILPAITACAGHPPRTGHAGDHVYAAPGYDGVPPDAIDPEATTYAYPYPAKFFELDSQHQRLRMAYLDVAPSQPNGRSVLLLHGKNFSAAAWTTTIALLSERGYRVIAPDQIGFGKSSKPAGYQYSFALLAQHTRALLASLGIERSHVVGHSMGGMLASRYALQFPQHVEQLVLVNPIGLEDYASLVPYRPIDAWYADELKQTPESIRDYQRKSYYAGQWSDAYEQLAKQQMGMTKHPDYAVVAWSSALLYDMIFTQPVVHDLPRLQVPTGLIIGTRDKTALGKPFATPEIAATMGDYTQLGKRAQSAIPNATLIELEGVGHCPQVEAFDRYREALLSLLP